MRTGSMWPQRNRLSLRGQTVDATNCSRVPGMDRVLSFALILHTLRERDEPGVRSSHDGAHARSTLQTVVNILVKRAHRRSPDCFTPARRCLAEMLAYFCSYLLPLSPAHHYVEGAAAGRRLC